MAADNTAVMPTSAQAPVVITGIRWLINAPNAPPIINNGEDAASGVRAQREDPDQALDNQHTRQQLPRCIAGDHLLDDAVAHAEGARKDQTAQANTQTSDGRPPHPVDGQLLKHVLAPVHGLAQARSQECGQNPKRQRTEHRRVVDRLAGGRHFE